jgi:hypothetical protein
MILVLYNGAVIHITKTGFYVFIGLFVRLVSLYRIYILGLVLDNLGKPSKTFV